MPRARIQAGDPAPPFQLTAVGDVEFDSRSLAGRHWLLSFQRYAT